MKLLGGLFAAGAAVWAAGAAWAAPVAGAPLGSAAIYAFPNPARTAGGETVTIRFPASRKATIWIYTMTGETVAMLSEPQVQAQEGRATWTGRNGAGELVASGVYLFVVQGPRSWVGKVTVLN